MNLRLCRIPDRLDHEEEQLSGHKFLENDSIHGIWSEIRFTYGVIPLVTDIFVIMSRCSYKFVGFLQIIKSHLTAFRCNRKLLILSGLRVGPALLRSQGTNLVLRP